MWTGIEKGNYMEYKQIKIKLDWVRILENQIYDLDNQKIIGINNEDYDLVLNWKKQ